MKADSFIFLASGLTLLCKCYTMGIPYVAILTFGSSFILALILTMDGKNVKILYQHPDLVLLPVFTFFTFTRIKFGCCGRPIDSKLVFSKKYTYINIILGTISVGCFVLSVLSSTQKAEIIAGLIMLTVLHALSVLLTILFMHMSSCCCCCGGCGCCNIHDGDHVYDPATGMSHPLQEGKFIIVDNDIRMTDL